MTPRGGTGEGRWLRVFGAAMIALGFGLVIGGEIAMPTRTPGRAFQFTGLSLWLLAAAPALIGVVFWRMGEAPDRRKQPLLRLLIGVGMALLGLAFVLSKTV